VIAGTGPSYLDLAADISAARAPVTLLGHRDDVADLLGAADLAVVTSVWEARQMFAQEVLRSGTPLVATAVGGIPDLVGDAAVLVPAADVDALDRAVRDLLDNPARRAEHAAAGRARAQTWPTEQDTLARSWPCTRSSSRPATGRDDPCRDGRSDADRAGAGHTVVVAGIFGLLFRPAAGRAAGRRLTWWSPARPACAGAAWTR
jgi:hypothetical protein